MDRSRGLLALTFLINCQCVFFNVFVEPVCVEIATPGYVGISNEVSLNCNGPAFDTAVSYLRETYHEIDFIHTYIIDNIGHININHDFSDSDQHLLAIWYYRTRRSECMPAIITIGTLSKAYAVIPKNGVGMKLSKI
jgi:hypothetical protein